MGPSKRLACVRVSVASRENSHKSWAQRGMLGGGGGMGSECGSGSAWLEVSWGWARSRSCEKAAAAVDPSYPPVVQELLV